MNKFIFKINPEHCPGDTFDNRLPELWEAGQFEVPWPRTLEGRKIELQEIMAGDVCWIWLHVERKKDKNRFSPGLVGEAIIGSRDINTGASTDDRRLFVRFSEVSFRAGPIKREQFEKHQERSKTAQDILRHTTRRVAALTDDQAIDFDKLVAWIDEEKRRVIEQYLKNSSASPGPVSLPKSGKGRPDGKPGELEEDRAAEAEYEENKKAEEEIRNRTNIGETEKARLIKARRGQGVFKRNLQNYESACRLTGVDDLRHLRASHIKPWRSSSDLEKLDGNNGLLLSPHVDHLFDRGYVSFSDTGELLVSESMESEVLEAWGLSKSQACGEFLEAQRVYLAHHRKHVFEKHRKKNTGI